MLFRNTTASLIALLATVVTARGATPQQTDADLDRRFSDTVLPFLNTYCVRCHSGEKPKAQFDLKPYSTYESVIKDQGHWAVIRAKLNANQMPPEEATDQPTAETRQKILQWIDAQRKNDALKHAGDPGIVLARRLTNAEYDYTIRDLTGVDLQPTREFPIDPANTAGFDNSGETLVMSPSLLNKYLKAAREVASHMYLTQQGFAFATRSMMSETDRDKICENQIIALYHQQNTDYADYFQTAWRFKHRAALGKPNASQADLAAEYKVSPKYLAMVWDLLENTKGEVGPVAKLQAMWQELPAPVKDQPDVARPGAEQMRAWVIQLRAKIEPRFTAPGRGGGQAMPIWINTQYATHRRTFDPKQLQVEGEARPEAAAPASQPAGRGRGGRGRGGAIANAPGDPDLSVPAGQREKYEASFAKFCNVFPDRFYTQERGTNYFNIGNETGRYLSAGFLNRMGYFRDDLPLYELILDEQQQKQLDSYWLDMDFIASATRRTYLQSFDAGSGQARAILGDGNSSPDDDLVTEANIKKYAEGQSAGSNEEGTKITLDYYQGVNDRIRWSEKARIEAEPKQLDALLDFANRAYRRSLSKAERDDLLAYYKSAREKDHLDHEAAVRDSIVYVLMSPDLTYRVDLVEGQSGVHPLSDYDLASRLSYFLWSSVPDSELLSHATAKDLHDPKVIAAQARRMLKDPRARALAVEFGTNWLEIRRFEDINTVDHVKFPSFTNELRDAMFEEPIRFILDVIQKDRSILDCLYANDTFVNPVLAKHYGMPDIEGDANTWVHIADANKYDRGSLLPMAAFLTKNAPGLRTSPVKRGNWMVKNILGERIAPPPVGVPEIPRDETKLDLPLPQMMARHRNDPNCASCHERFDSLGLVFEGFGPVGERRQKDLADRPVDSRATFPDGSEGAGIEGVRKYIRERRQNDYIDNLCGKLLAYGLGRSLISSDEILIDDMHGKLAANGHRFDIMIESIVTSPQFLNKRGRDGLAER